MTTAEKIQEVIRLISEGKSASSAIKEVGISKRTFFGAVLDSDEIGNQYARATELRAAIMFDQIEQIADDSSGDETYDNNGNPKQNTEFIQRSKLRVDARKWMLARMNPRKYGDRINIDHDAENKGTPPNIIWKSERDNS